tara:strand:- start:266 stop:574 length:309 start_codon:yes stop_codon:yes gene_type:complete
MRYKLCPECDKQFDLDMWQQCPECGWELPEVEHPYISEDYLEGGRDSLRKLIEYLEDKIETCEEVVNGLDALDCMCDEIYIRLAARKATYESILHDHTGDHK